MHVREMILAHSDPSPVEKLQQQKRMTKTSFAGCERA